MNTTKNRKGIAPIHKLVFQLWTPMMALVLLAALSAVAVVLACFLLVRQSGYDRTSTLSYILQRQWERSVNIFSISYIVITVLEIMVVSKVVRKLIVSLTQDFGARAETVGRLLDSFIKYVGSIFLAFSCVGMQTSTIVTSASILTIVIGFGANKLIGDILAGIFIVFEGEFRVGDIVTIDDWRGTVLEIGIRTTKVEDVNCNIKIFSNSAISGVVNMTKQYSYAVCHIGIEYGESIERVESILKEELPKVAARLPAITSGPFYRGVVELGDSGTVLRIMAQCSEESRAQLSHDLNREFKLIFDRNNISIPSPQFVLNEPSQEVKVATKAEKAAAREFVQEQEMLSKHIFEDDEDVDE